MNIKKIVCKVLLLSSIIDIQIHAEQNLDSLQDIALSVIGLTGAWIIYRSFTQPDLRTKDNKTIELPHRTPGVSGLVYTPPIKHVGAVDIAQYAARRQLKSEPRIDDSCIQSVDIAIEAPYI